MNKRRTSQPSPAANRGDRQKQIGIRLPASIADRLESIARAEHNGVSSVVRRLLTVALAATDNEAA